MMTHDDNTIWHENETLRGHVSAELKGTRELAPALKIFDQSFGTRRVSDEKLNEIVARGEAMVERLLEREKPLEASIYRALVDALEKKTTGPQIDITTKETGDARGLLKAHSRLKISRTHKRTPVLKGTREAPIEALSYSQFILDSGKSKRAQPVWMQLERGLEGHPPGEWVDVPVDGIMLNAGFFKVAGTNYMVVYLNGPKSAKTLREHLGGVNAPAAPAAEECAHESSPSAEANGHPRFDPAHFTSFTKIGSQGNMNSLWARSVRTKIFAAAANSKEPYKDGSIDVEIDVEVDDTIHKATLHVGIIPMKRFDALYIGKESLGTLHDIIAQEHKNLRTYKATVGSLPKAIVDHEDPTPSDSLMLTPEEQHKNAVKQSFGEVWQEIDNLARSKGFRLGWGTLVGYKSWPIVLGTVATDQFTRKCMEAQTKFGVADDHTAGLFQRIRELHADYKLVLQAQRGVQGR